MQGGDALSAWRGCRRSHCMAPARNWRLNRCWVQRGGGPPKTFLGVRPFAHEALCTNKAMSTGSKGHVA
eukprot:1154751-Pelagomonas_calceolata.AAC.6